MPKNIPGPDLKMIKSAYFWLPQLEEAQTKTERKEWNTFFKEILTYTIEMLKIEDAETRRRGDDLQLLGNDFGSWFMTRLADFILHLAPDEKPRFFWKLFLELGTNSYWVQVFLDKWVLAGLNEKNYSYRENFIREWRAMFEYALSSRRWNQKYLGEWPDYKTWQHLAGLAFFSLDVWSKTEYTGIISQMIDLYQRWAAKILPISLFAPRFIRFLIQPAAEGMILIGLQWIEEAGEKQGDDYWSNNDVQKALEDLVEFCWRSHSSKIRNDQASFRRFRRILSKLAKAQNPVALVLQQQLVGRR